MLVLHPDALREGEPVLSAVSALEAGIRPRALKEGLVRVRQVFQDIADLAAAGLPQPRVLGIPPQGGEFLVHAEGGHTGGVLPVPFLVGRVLLLLAGQKVIAHKPTGARCTGQLVRHRAALRQQAQPHTAVDSLGLGLCYIGPQQAWKIKFPVCEGAVGRLKRLSLPFVIPHRCQWFHRRTVPVIAPVCVLQSLKAPLESRGGAAGRVPGGDC